MPKITTAGVARARKAAIDVEFAAHELHVAALAAGRAAGTEGADAAAANVAAKLDSLKVASSGVVSACEAAIEK